MAPTWLAPLLALGLDAATLGFSWRTGQVAVPGLGQWLWLWLYSAVLRQSHDLDIRLDTGPLRTGDLVSLAVYVLAFCIFVWQAVNRFRRRTPSAR